MKKLWKNWKSGLLVGFKYFWFSLVFSFLCMPIYILQILFTWNVDQCPPVFAVLYLLWMPIAFHQAAKFTHDFEEPEAPSAV